MWNFNTETISEDISKYKITFQGATINKASFIQYLKSSTGFIQFLNSILENSPYAAFFWEVHPFTKHSMEQDFEFVLVNSSALTKISTDPRSFRNQFDRQKPVVSFPNLGKNALLVVPTPIGALSCYGHLANFVRKAPEEQKIAFWKTVGMELDDAIGEAPKWLSTAGLGVHWLHLRIDSKPKYYRYKPYKLID